MRKIIWIAIFLGFATSLFAEGQATPSASASVVSRQPYHIKIYAVGPDVTAPELLPLDPFPAFTEICKRKLHGGTSYMRRRENPCAALEVSHSGEGNVSLSYR